MDAIAHTQVSGFCLVTLAVLLRAQQKMRDKSLPGRQFTALLWFAGALTIVDYGSALAQLGAWEELGIPLTYRRVAVCWCFCMWRQSWGVHGWRTAAGWHSAPHR